MADDHSRRARPYTAAGVVFFDAAGRVLLVRPTYKPGWEAPGGAIERGESPLGACRREVREELGIAPPIGRLLVVDWAPHPHDGDRVLYVFDGGELAPEDLAAVRLDADELAEYSFHTVEEATAVLVPRLARRLSAAVRARNEGRTLYLEHGQEPGEPQHGDHSRQP
jgi:8-oxo-dGTP pyrophosphatase MutT (NUDIX family)